MLTKFLYKRLIIIIVSSAGDGVLLRLKGSEVTVNYFERNGFKIPIIVEQKEGLGLRVPPPDFRISDVERYVGECKDIVITRSSKSRNLIHVHACTCIHE